MSEVDGAGGHRIGIPDNRVILPDDDLHIPDTRLPSPEKDHPDDPFSREELELALERAKLVADDCASILSPAVQAMQDGAWVSRRADEFSLALDHNARIAGDAGRHVVEFIEELLSRPDVGPPVVLPEPEYDVLPADPIQGGER